MIDSEDRKTLKELPYPYNLMEVLREQAQDRADDDEVENMDFTPSAIREMVNDALTERERQIIEQRYRDGLTLEKTAAAHNVTRERIRQIEAKALRKLNHPGRMRKYAAVPYRDYQSEHLARLRAEAQIDWFLQHSDYNVSVDDHGEPKLTPKSVLDKTIDDIYNDMDLSVRSYNCLKRARINTVGEIVALDYGQAIGIRSLGRRSLDEIEAKIHSLGLKMKWEREDG